MPGEIERCPKGWGHVIFMEKNVCPISGAGYCVMCTVGTKTDGCDRDWHNFQREKEYQAKKVNK